MKTAREDTMKAVGNLQLCAGQQAGAEAAVHAAKEIFADKATLTSPSLSFGQHRKLGSAWNK